MKTPAFEASGIPQRLSNAAIPDHLAVIPDGNRRWAERNGRTVMEGHRAGFEVAKALSRFCRRIGIHTVTIWAFSTENWRRSGDQVSALMDLYAQWLTELLPEAVEEEVRVIHLGRLEGVPEEARAAAEAAGHPDGLPQNLRTALADIEMKTEGFNRNVINLAINYGGHDEIQRAVAAMLAQAGRAGTGQSPDIQKFLDSATQPYPNPDIVWRTSGEFRSSGFLPLQSAYSEMIFTPKYFPELTEEDIADAVLEYSARKRRFGS